MNPTACPTGYYCPEGTISGQSYPCPIGTFGPNQYLFAQDNCTTCTAGYYCEQAGLSAPTAECYGGYYCTGGAEIAEPISHNVSYFPCFFIHVQEACRVDKLMSLSCLLSMINKVCR